MSRRDERDARSAPSSASGTHGAPLLAALLWPVAAALAFQSAALSIMTPRAADRHEPPPAPDWPTPHRITLELQTMRLRDFSRRPEGPPALICAPLALHGASVADFASGHSLVETLLDAGLARVLVTDWRSATPDLRHLTIDNHLAELNVAVDDCGAPVDLVGLCQGGWLALLYAARFPHKVRRLVIAGAPVDIRAGASPLSRLVDDLPLAAFEEMVRAGGGRLIGARAREAWPTLAPSRVATDVLQAPAAIDEGALRALLDRFATWDAATVDLPGPYYLQVVQWLFKENRIARGTFVTLGRAVNLRDVRCPAYLLAARRPNRGAGATLGGRAPARHAGARHRDCRRAGRTPEPVPRGPDAARPLAPHRPLAPGRPARARQQGRMTMRAKEKAPALGGGTRGRPRRGHPRGVGCRLAEPRGARQGGRRIDMDQARTPHGA